VVPGSTYSARRTCTTRTSAYDSEFDSITISECSRTIPHCIYSYVSAGYEWSWMISQSLMVYAPQIIFTQRSHWGPFFLTSPFRSFLRGAGSSFGSIKDQTEHHWGWDVGDIPIMDQFWDVALWCFRHENTWNLKNQLTAAVVKSHDRMEAAVKVTISFGPQMFAQTICLSQQQSKWDSGTFRSKRVNYSSFHGMFMIRSSVGSKRMIN
jgi:hypothetical protein